MRAFVGLTILVAFVLWFAAMREAPWDPEKTAAADPVQVKAARAKRDAIEKFVIKNFAWSKSEFGVMTASFIFENKNDFDVKDVEVQCQHSAPSGTRIDSNTRTIYEVFRARSQRTIKSFNMGFIHSQVSQTGCGVANLVIGERRQPPASSDTPKTSTAPAPRKGAADQASRPVGEPLSLSPR